MNKVIRKHFFQIDFPFAETTRINKSFPTFLWLELSALQQQPDDIFGLLDYVYSKGEPKLSYNNDIG